MQSAPTRAAIEAYERGLTAAPKDSLFWTEIARFRYQSGNQQGAIDASAYAVALDHNNVRALEFRGQMVRSQFGLVAAIPWFERGLKVNPNDVPLLEEYAATLGDAGRYRDMLTQARRIIAIDKGNGRAYYMQAVIAARARDYALARRILAKAGQEMNAQPGAMLVAAISEYELGNFNQAIDIFRQLVVRQQTNMEYRKLLARAMYRGGDAFDALDAIKAVAGRADADNYTLMVAARSFEATGDRGRAAIALGDAAQPLIRRAVPLDESLTLADAAKGARDHPNDARYILPYIRSLIVEKRYDVAADVAKRLQLGNPGVAKAHLIVGDVAVERGNMIAAIDAYNKARVIAFSQETMLRLVDGYRRTRNGGAAREVLTSYLAYNPGDLLAQRYLAYLMLDNRQWATAIALLEHIKARIGVNDGILLAHLARAYSQIGDNTRATANAALAYRIDPANPLVTHIYGQVLAKSGARPKAARELLTKAAILMPDNVEVKADLAKLKS